MGFLVVAPAAILLVLTATAIRSAWSGWLRVGALLIVAGGASNLVDRVVPGSVVDFVNVGVGSLRTGIFNIADVALVAGIAFMLLRRGGSEHPNRSAKRDDSP